MIYITQLIYLVAGQEAILDQFEEMAIPLIAKYQGQLLMRVRPDQTAYIQSAIAQPYEIHLVAFASDHDLNNFMQDKERQEFLHLKEQSIQSVLLIKGTPL